MQHAARLLFVLFAACGARTDLVERDSIAGDAHSPDASSDVSTPDAGTGCRGLPREPRVLVDDESIEPAVVTVRGGTLSFGAQDVRGPLDEPTSGIWQVPITGGRHERLELAQPYYANVSGLLVGADYIVYHQVSISPSPGAGWSFDYPAIVVERGADARVLPTDTLTGTAPMALLGDRVIFGRDDPEDVGSIGLYEARSGMETTIGRADVTAAVGAGRNAYLWTFDEGEGVLVRVTAAADVIELERFGDASCCWPWAADSRALYLWRRDAIEAWPVGEDRVVIAETSPPKFASVAIDDDNLYWSDEGRIHYVDKEGGVVQTLVDHATMEVRALTTDGCGVYYSVANPPRIMVVSVP